MDEGVTTPLIHHEDNTKSFTKTKSNRRIEVLSLIGMVILLFMFMTICTMYFEINEKNDDVINVTIFATLSAKLLFLLVSIMIFNTSYRTVLEKNVNNDCTLEQRNILWSQAARILFKYDIIGMCCTLSIITDIQSIAFLSRENMEMFTTMVMLSSFLTGGFTFIFLMDVDRQQSKRLF